jgi:hypothetical protein
MTEIRRIFNFGTVRLNYTENDVKNAVKYVHDRFGENYVNKKGIQPWQIACVSMMFTHAYEILKDPNYLAWAKNALYVDYGISDDQCWGANAILELNRNNVEANPEDFGGDKPLNNRYQDIFDKTLTTEKGEAEQPYNGFYCTEHKGIYWDKKYNSFNTCTMGQAICLAYNILNSGILEINNKQVGDFGKEWLERVLINSLIDEETGRVYDNCGYDLQPRTGGEKQFTYNNGTSIAALALAAKYAKYNPKKVHSYGNLADKCMNYVMNKMLRSGALCSPDAETFENFAADRHAFNGIFMHFIPYYLLSDDIPFTETRNIAIEWIKTQANLVWGNILKIQKFKNQDCIYDVSYNWEDPSDYGQGNFDCMTTVSGIECLLTGICASRVVRYYIEV